MPDRFVDWERIYGLREEMSDGSTDRKGYPTGKSVWYLLIGKCFVNQEDARRIYGSREEMSDGFEERVCPKDAPLFARMSAKAREVRLVF